MAIRKHYDGTVIENRDGVLVATSYLEGDEELLDDENYQYASGPRNSEGRIPLTHEEAGTKAASKDDKAAKKSAAKKTAKR